MKKNALLLLLLSFQPVFIMGSESNSDSDSDFDFGRNTSRVFRSILSPSQPVYRKSSAVMPGFSPTMDSYEAISVECEWQNIPTKVLSEYPFVQEERRSMAQASQISPNTAFALLREDNNSRYRSGFASQMTVSSSPESLAQSSLAGLSLSSPSSSDCLFSLEGAVEDQAFVVVGLQPYNPKIPSVDQAAASAISSNRAVESYKSCSIQ